MSKDSLVVKVRRSSAALQGLPVVATNMIATNWRECGTCSDAQRGDIPLADPAFLDPHRRRSRGAIRAMTGANLGCHSNNHFDFTGDSHPFRRRGGASKTHRY